MPSSLTSRLVAILFALLASIHYALAASTCYVAAYGLVGKQDGWNACPGTSTSSGVVETCCMPGSECGEDSLCHVQGADDSDNAWYQAGCTDPNYQDEVCRNDCAGYSQSYVQYDDATKLWMCCGNGGCNGTTTDDTFQAVSPDDWKVITGSGSSTASTGAPSAAASSKAIVSGTQTRMSSADFKPSPTQPDAKGGDQQTAGSTDSHDGGLSTGAEAGIGVAIGLALLALIAALVAMFMMRKRNRQRQARVDEKAFSSEHSPPPSYLPTSELSAERQVHELAGEQGGYHWNKRH